MIPWWEGNKKYGADQTGDSLLFVWWLESWLAVNFTSIKSKLYNFSLLHGLTSNPHLDNYICSIDRNLNSQTTMLEDHISRWIHNSWITTVFHKFSDSYSVYRSIITDHANPFQTLTNDSTLQRSARRGMASCHYRNHAKIAVLVCMKRGPIQYGSHVST